MHRVECVEDTYRTIKLIKTSNASHDPDDPCTKRPEDGESNTLANRSDCYSKDNFHKFVTTREGDYLLPNKTTLPKESYVEARCPGNVTCNPGTKKGDCAISHTLTTFEVTAVTSVRMCTGVAYLAAPGGPLVESPSSCTADS